MAILTTRNLLTRFYHIVLFCKTVLIQIAYHVLCNTVGNCRKFHVAHFGLLFFGESLKYPQKGIFIRSD